MAEVVSGPNLERSDSFTVTATQSAAEAFGDDIADDSYSVSELSHYNDGRRKKRGGEREKGKGDDDESFVRPKLGIERTGSDKQKDDGSDEKQRHLSTDSTDQSDDTGAFSADSDDTDMTITTFVNFAQSRFQMKIPHSYSCSALPQPLLPTTDRAEYLAAMASWVTILRIMGDLPDVDAGDTLVVAGTHVPVIAKTKKGFKTKYTKKDIEAAHKKYSELFKDPLGTDTQSIPFLPGTADTMLDKVQLVCAIGIYKPTLRDELYCQLCKQLTNNPSRNSLVRGWVLMSLFAGSFAPSERFAASLTTFVRDGPSEFSEKVDRLLRRTCSVGTRSYPPSWLEFQAAKNSKPLLVPVTFMSGYRMLCEVDAATTVIEVIRNISARLGLQDATGFSLYVSLHTQISCLGHGQHRVMDAISECEQHTKQMGVRESNALWRIFFRREFFSAWYNPENDPMSCDLEYQQIKRGITMGEYKFEKEDTLIEYTAKFYYAEYPEDRGYDNLFAFTSTFIPENIQERRPREYFPERVRAMYEAHKLGTDKPSADFVKADIVRFAMEKFFINFSRYYDVTKVTGPNLQVAEGLMAVNSKGIYIVDGMDQLQLHIQFCEIVGLSKSKNWVTLRLAGSEDIVLSTHHVEDFFTLVTSCTEELKKRSRTAIAKQDFTQLDNSDVSVGKGDILELRESLADSGEREMTNVTNKKTRKFCEVPVNLVYVVATVDTVQDSILERLATHVRKNVSNAESADGKTKHTLQQFAKKYFRPANESAMTKLLNKASLKKKDSDCLWSHTKDGLKKPLLKRSNDRDDIRKLACHCFTSIQTYMSSVMINDEATNYNLCSEWILEPARRNKYIRDEVYCQIIKQLTNNPEKTSEDKGWVLLTLLTSLTSPSHELLEECLAFVHVCDNPLVAVCANNLKCKKSRGGSRLYTSHTQEHEMFQKYQPNIRVQVFLPNQTVQTLEVTSQTLIFDMKKEIAQRLCLKTFHEYSLFLTSNDKVHCLSDRSFYFDCLSHAEVYWLKGGKRNSQSSSKSTSVPMLVMLKKIWVNGQPGIDPVADQVFHFSQERPNYLRGYHQMSRDRVIKLAALLYRALFGGDDKQFSDFRDLAPQILPKGFVSSKDAVKIEMEVKKEYDASHGKTEEEAKKEFIEELSYIATYGSVFFEVKQRHVKSLPKYCLMAVNYSGVHIIDGATKNVIKTFFFESIPNWAYDEMSFTLIMADRSGTSKLLFETNVGHNMDDLLMSYVAWIMNYQMRKKHGFLGDTAGESIC